MPFAIVHEVRKALMLLPKKGKKRVRSGRKNAIESVMSPWFIVIAEKQINDVHELIPFTIAGEKR